VGKVTGRKIHEIEGIEIYVTQRPAKRSGRDRIWIQIRQKKQDKPWRMGTALAYSRAADIEFEREARGPTRD
jgi:hypothetical protein